MPKLRVVRLPRLSRRVVVVASLPAAVALVATAFVSPPLADAARPQPTVTRTVTATATVTQTVTPAPQTVTVTQPAQTVTTTVTAPPVTSTQTVTVTASPTSPTSSATTTAAPTTTSPTTTPSSTTTTTAPPPTGACPVAGVNKPGASDGNGGCFPGPGNTGVPAGTVLTVVNGDYTVTTANARVDALDIRGTLRIKADGVTITRVKVADTIQTDTGSRSFTVTDSELHSASLDFKVFWNADRNFTALRNEISGGQSGGSCSDCVLRDNWIHNPTVLPTNSTAHMSAFRMSQRATFIHNTIACEVKQSAADGGCSAGLTGYGDFEAVTNNLVEGNLFAAMPYASFCTYGGASAGKPYSGQDHDIVIRDNVFQRGTTGKCAVYDPIGDFNPSRPNNTAVGNVWDDGTKLPDQP